MEEFFNAIEEKLTMGGIETKRRKKRQIIIAANGMFLFVTKYPIDRAQLYLLQNARMVLSG